MTRMQWEIGDRLSPLHAGRCWAAGARGIDSQCEQAIAPPLTQLTRRLAAADIDLATFWKRLVTEAAAGNDDAKAARTALVAAGAGELTLDATASAVTSLLADTRLAFQQRYPKLADQLALRGRPLREQWDSYGPGLMRRIATLTHETFTPRSAGVILLAPYRGGDGGCDPRVPKLWIEAVLTNPIATVPEVLRLVWLAARIGTAAKVLSGTLETDPQAARRTFDVISLALLPVTLEAGGYLEISGDPAASPDLIVAAVQAWTDAADSTTVEILQRWWTQSQELRPPFPVALKALDRMLPGEPSLLPGTLHEKA